MLEEVEADVEHVNVISSREIASKSIKIRLFSLDDPFEKKRSLSIFIRSP